MKKTTILLLLIINSIIYSQEDLKDLYKKLMGDKLNTEVQGLNKKQGQTDISKISIDTLNITNFTKDTIENLNYFEKYVRGEIIDPYTQDSVIYRYKVDFSKIKPQMLNSTRKIPDNYSLSPGDKLVLDLWGSITQSYNITLNNDGYFIIPSIGKVDYQGLNYKELKQTLNTKLNKISGLKYAFHLSSISPIQLFITGQVKNPGFYNVSPFANILEVLAAAGGTTINGSIRNLTIKSDNKTTKLDTYDFLFKGINQSNPIQSEAIIHVPFVAGEVAITGNVKNQAIFELKEGEKLQDILEFAKLVPFADKQRIEIERLTENGRKTIISTSINKNPTINNGDIIRIFSSLVYNDNYIYLKGNFRQNGKKEFKKNLNLKNIFCSQDIIFDDTYLQYGKIIRKNNQGKRNSIISFSLESVFKNQEDANITLCNQDTIVTFKLDSIVPYSTVTINGEVRKPNDYNFHEGMKLADLIEQAGGYTKQALLDSLEIFNELTNKKTIINLTTNSKNTSLHEGDIVTLYKDSRFNRKTIVITGEVNFPGKYVINENDTFYSLIKRCKGFTPKAYLAGTRLFRESVRQRNLERINKLQKNLKEKLAALALIKKNPSYLTLASTQEIDTLQITGRMVIPIENSKPVDFNLLNEDSIYIPEKNNTVYVSGEVVIPSTFLIRENENYLYYINKSGGLTDFSDIEDVVIIRANGEVLKSNWEEEVDLNDYVLENGDVIWIPYDYNKGEGWELTKDIVSVLYKLGIASGTIINATK